MPRFSPFASLEKSLTRLAAERQEHADALARIDALFAKFGICACTCCDSAAETYVAAPAPAAKVAKSRKRKHFGQTAEEFVLSLLDGRNLVTGEVNNAWVSAGRSGKADNTLSILTKKKLLKRTPLKDGRGSTYTVA